MSGPRAYNKWNTGIVRFASMTRTKYDAISGVLFEPMSSVATDGRRLVCIDCPVIEIEKAPEAINKGDGEAVLVHQDDVKMIEKTLPRRTVRHTADGVAGFRATSNTFISRARGERRSMTEIKPLEEKYPKWRNLLPKKKPTLTMRFNGVLLGEVMTYLGQFAEHDGYEVVLNFYGDEDPVKVEAKNSYNEQKAVALVMPMNKEEQEDGKQ